MAQQKSVCPLTGRLQDQCHSYPWPGAQDNKNWPVLSGTKRWLTLYLHCYVMTLAIHGQLSVHGEGEVWKGMDSAVL